MHQIDEKELEDSLKCVQFTLSYLDTLILDQPEII